jgi:hypothetical protein
MVVNEASAVKDAYYVSLLYELHVAREKLRLFEAKYGKTLVEFEKEVTSRKEDFEKWDDYLEWKAYVKLVEDLEKKKQQLEFK